MATSDAGGNSGSRNDRSPASFTSGSMADPETGEPVLHRRPRRRRPTATAPSLLEPRRDGRVFVYEEADAVKRILSLYTEEEAARITELLLMRCEIHPGPPGSKSSKTTVARLKQLVGPKWLREIAEGN